MPANANWGAIIVGAGPAGITAAIALAKMDVPVLVIEAGTFPGAENWSGTVYFAENLAQPDVLGAEAVERLAYERRVVKRGFFAYDGQTMVGVSYKRADTFRHCYTVLRPTFDHHLAQLARQFGATILTQTTVDGLVREQRRVIGVHTNRGCFYGDVVFLAEGDAAHLVTKEGYERTTEPGAPHFLQGVKEVIEVDPAFIEREFGLRPGQGAAFEILLRNGSLKNRDVRLNMGGFLYTNAASISLGLVVPLANLASEFNGDHNRLMEWYKSLPEIKRMCGGNTKSIAYGAKIIRGGGIRELPQLVDDGLAIGGAASGIGVDFPYPNFTGPATAMGRLFAHAVQKIRKDNGLFSRAKLEELYAQPLRQTRYFKDVEYLRDWPKYVEHTTFFFGRTTDLVTGSFYTLSRRELSTGRKLGQLAKLVNELVPPKDRAAAREDVEAQIRALGLKKFVDSPWLLCPGGSWLLNTFVPGRTKPPPDGEFEVLCFVDGQRVPLDDLPWFARWFTRRFNPALAAAAHAVYRNDDAPISEKLEEGLSSITRHLNFWDLLVGSVPGVVFAAHYMRQTLRAKRTEPSAAEEKSLYAQNLEKLRLRRAFDEETLKIQQPWDTKLGFVQYFSEPCSHIKVLRPELFQKRGELIKSPLWRICPAKVYEVMPDDLGQSQIIVNFENCLKCETCWRTTTEADWTRARQQRLIFQSFTRADSHRKLFDALCQPAPKRLLPTAESKQQQDSRPEGSAANVAAALNKFALKLREFVSEVYREPRHLEQSRFEWLRGLLDYAEALLAEIPGSTDAKWAELRNQFQQAKDYLARRKLFWAASAAQLLLDHHLPSLGWRPPTADDADAFRPETAAWRERVRKQLDSTFTKQAIKHIEHFNPLPEPQAALLRALVAEAFDSADSAQRRKLLLEELGRKDPSLALLVASQFVAADLLGGAQQQWHALAIQGDVQAVPMGPQTILRGKKLFVLSALADQFLVYQDGQLYSVPRNAQGLTIEPTQAIGLYGAGVARLKFDGVAAQRLDVQDAEKRLEASIAANLCPIMLGAGRILLERTKSHATSRVQFPGLFKDEDGHDGIAKFGAIKRFISEMEADVLLLEILSSDDLNLQLDPATMKAVAAEAFGPEEGSLTYNAGQVLGGTAYSEDDIFSKFYRDSSVLPFLWLDDHEQARRHAPTIVGRLRKASARLQPLATAAKRGLKNEMELLQRACARLEQVTGSVADKDAETLLAWEFASAERHLVMALALLLHTHQRQEAGLPSEKCYHAARIMLDRAITAANRLGTQDALATAKVGAAILNRGYPEKALQTRVAYSYKEMLQATPPYDSGEFLAKPFDSAAPRYLPELLYQDEELRKLHDENFKFFYENYASKTFDGLPYPRYVERRHRVPPEDIRKMITAGHCRMFIPPEYGGRGLSKAAYYDLIQLSLRYADPAYALTVQVNSSLSTTPVMLGLFQDLPRAQRDLKEILEEPKTLNHARAEIERMLKMMQDGQTEKVRDIYKELSDLMRKESGKKPLLRMVAGEFLGEFSKAGRAGMAQKYDEFVKGLEKALAALAKVPQRAKEFAAELARREEAHKLYLRWVASGQIAGFALTEPNAGSDTAGISTRAALKRVEVLTDADGVKYFMLGNHRKNIIDASRLVFDNYRPLYKYSDSAPPAPIIFDEYDYNTDDPSKFRYYMHGTRRVDIHDIAQIRRDGDKEYYEYYELNGAKMWITSGRFAGIFALYARTPEGPTGFMVDRHAEGLIIGNDEEKMGQRGSATNEIGLTAVRVPRENVIGLEGRGQVNALDTLNIGRVGIAISSITMACKLIEQTRAFARSRGLDREPWVQRLLGEMTEEALAGETIAYELVGMYDCKQVKSVRMEASISKFAVSEALHRIIRKAELIYGIEGQTVEHELEKHRRDARVLNIYEGTNEIQRFLILRDLLELGGKLKDEHQPLPGGASTEIHKYEAARNQVLQDVKAAAQAFGPMGWQNAGFQPVFFKLAEMAGSVKLMDSVIRRANWLRNNVPDTAPETDRTHRDTLLAATELFIQRALFEIESRHAAFTAELAALQRGVYPSQTRCAEVALQEDEEHEKLRALVKERPKVRHHVERPLNIVVLAQPQPVLSPRPRAMNGQLLEPCFDFAPSVWRAIEEAVAIKRDAQNAKVTVTLVAAAPAFCEELLRFGLATGADKAVLVDTGKALIDGAVLAELVTQVCPPVTDLILTGDTFSIEAALLAEKLGLHQVANVAELRLEPAGAHIRIEGLDAVVPRNLPLVVSLAGGGAAAFGAEDYAVALRKPLDIVKPAKPIEAAARFETPLAVAAAAGPVRIGLPEDVAKLVLQAAGAGEGAAAEIKPFAGEIKTLTPPTAPWQDAVSCWLPLPSGDELFSQTALGTAKAATALGRTQKTRSCVLVLTADDPVKSTKLRLLAGQLASVGADAVVFATHRSLGAPATEGLVEALGKMFSKAKPRLLLSPVDGAEVVARVAARMGFDSCFNAKSLAARNGSLSLTLSRFSGKVNAVVQHEAKDLAITVAEGVGVEPHPPAAETPVSTSVFVAPLELSYDATKDALAQALLAAAAEIGVKSISDADFIIDAGYALRTKEQFNNVISPLKAALEVAGVKNVMIGGTRKVVEELKLLPADRQIGQTGVTVNPAVLLAIGVSGAPQHLDYIGERAVIFAFNTDADAPLMTLNKRKARPKVYPIVGDLYENVPKLVEALRKIAK